MLVTFTQGDDVTLNLIAQMGDGSRINLTGATFSTTMRGNNGVIVTFPNSQHTANPDQTAHKGEFTLALIEADTNSTGAGSPKDIVTEIIIGGKVVYFHGTDVLTVLVKTPLK